MFTSCHSAIALFLHVALFVRASIASEPVGSTRSVVRSVAGTASGVPAHAPSLGGQAFAKEKSPVRKIDKSAPHDEPFTSGLLIEFCIGLVGFTVTLMFQHVCRKKSSLVRKRSIPSGASAVRQSYKSDNKVPSPQPALHTTAWLASHHSNVPGPESEDGDGEAMVRRAELRKLLAVVTTTPQPKDVPSCVLRTIASMEEREPMSSKQIVDCLTHLLRCSASTKCFKEGVAVFECLESRIGDANPNLWSLLLYVATEAGRFDRCEAFYARLQCGCGPAGRDFVNIVRVFAKRQDMAGLTAALDDIKKARYEHLMCDRVVRNRALGACYKENADALAVAIANTDAFVIPIDIVGYNTLIACSTRAGQYKRCFATFDEIEAKLMQPTEATFGSLLEACCGANEVSRAKAYIVKIKHYGLRVNAVHLTTLIKALVAEKRLLEAERLLGELSSDCDVKPDIIVFYTLMRAFTDHADMKAAMRVYDQMAIHDLRPDEFVFNALINGCAVDETVTTNDFHGLIDKLLADGLKPTTTTLSIMLKALARCGSWDDALALLEHAPARFNARVETRLYVQLAQAAIKANCKGHALRIHDAMLLVQGRRGQEGKAASRWLLKQCDVHPLHKARDHYKATAKENNQQEGEWISDQTALLASQTLSDHAKVNLAM